MNPPALAGLPHKLLETSRENKVERKTAKRKAKRDQKGRKILALGFITSFIFWRFMFCFIKKTKNKTAIKDLKTIVFAQAGGENQGGRFSKGKSRIRKKQDK
ncbi:unnamed protein product [marine sediment metagenome]|uniref:Uncharacterized protein n=1 Tax=marine sediment metagenome TaxID=412755 RepID=X1KCR3_9ZZZZ